MSLFNRSLFCLASVALLAAPASAVTINFDEIGSLTHGSIINTQFAPFGIDSITVTNIGGGPDLGVIFDTGFGGSTSDEDLLTPFDGGNLAGMEIGQALIIQENTTGCGDGVCNNPDDEGSRPAGNFDIAFTTSVLSFGFDIVDVDSTTAELGNVMFFDGASSVTIQWTDFEAGGAFAVPGLVFANNFANRIPEITAAELGLSQFDRIVINMGGSGAVDTFTFLPIPEPTTAILFGLGLAALATRRN